MVDERKIKAKETLDVLENGFTTSKRIHPGYLEYEEAIKTQKPFLKKYKIPKCFGKWQYFFEKGNMRISLIRINDRPMSGEKSKWVWEIHAFEDKRVFENCKKFRTKKEAMKEVINMLGN